MIRITVTKTFKSKQVKSFLKSEKPSDKSSIDKEREYENREIETENTITLLEQNIDDEQFDLKHVISAINRMPLPAPENIDDLHVPLPPKPTRGT